MAALTGSRPGRAVTIRTMASSSPCGLTQRLRRSVIRGLDRAAELCGALPGREHALFGLVFGKEFHDPIGAWYHVPA